MNQTEKKGLSWLLNQGYHDENIIFQHTKTPDFLTSDDKGYEVKRIYGSIIWFHKAQLEQLKHRKNTFVLAFNDKESEPVEIIDAIELDTDEWHGKVKVHVVDKTGITLVLTEKAESILRGKNQHRGDMGKYVSELLEATEMKK